MAEDLVFICLGDSLTAGSPGFSGFALYRGNPASQYEYWAEKELQNRFGKELSEKDIDVEIVNYGVGGDTIQGIYRRYRLNILPLLGGQPHYVIVWIGINNINQGWAPDEIAPQIAELYEYIMKNNGTPIGVEVAPVTMPPFIMNRVKELNRMLREICKEKDICLVKLFEPLLNSEKDGLNPAYDIGDGVHFNVNGYKRIGEVIFTEAIGPIVSKFLKEISI